MYEKWKRLQYYVIIGIISLIALLFLPMLGSEAGLTWIVPTTTVGWIVYIASKLVVSGTNILIFHCFILQGKTNILNHPNYIKAQEILCNVEKKEFAPKSPQEWHKSVYGKKGTTVFITTLLSSIGLTQAVLTFNLVTFLTYLFTVIGGIIFGILQMNQEEIYWTEEYLAYAKLEKEKHDDNLRKQRIEELRGTSTQEQTGHSEALPGDTATC